MGLSLPPATARNVGTASVTLYTAPASKQVTINEILLCNISGALVNVTVEYFDGTNHTRLAYNAPVPVGSTLPFQCKVNLQAGHEIRVTSSAASSIDAFASPAELS